MAYPTDLTRSGEDLALMVRSNPNDPEMIRRQMDHTRAQMENTITAIGERLSPENLIEQAKSSAREATVGRIKDMTYEANRRVEGMSQSLSQTIRDNPLPVALISLGVGWLWMSGRNKPAGYRGNNAYYPYNYEEGNGRGRFDEAREWVGDTADAAGQKASQAVNRAGETLQNVSEAVGDATHRAGESASATIYRAGEAVGETAEAVEERVGATAWRTRQEAERLSREARRRSQMAMDRTKRSFWETMDENPLVVGAVVAVAGLAVGASIPATRYEDELFGETRDHLLDEAKMRTQDTVERVQAVVGDAQRAAVAEAKEAAHRQNLTIEDTTGENGASYTP